MKAGALLYLDLIMIVLMLVLAIGALHARSLRQAVILFIVFGLVVALAWARLRAPDIALAEAAIGSGLAGALLLAALRDRRPGDDAARRAPVWQSMAVGGLVTALVMLLAWAFLEVQGGRANEPLANIVQAKLHESGVSNPVTAVLLNFRAYDTLLELTVLLAALLGVMSLGPQRSPMRSAEPMATGLIGWLIPLLILAGGYLLWVGAHAPGGAFQAGALLAAAAVLAHLGGRREFQLPGHTRLRLLAVAGCAVFTLVGVATLLGSGVLLQLPPDWAGGLILLIELFATASIATALFLVYLGGHPPSWNPREVHPDA